MSLALPSQSCTVEDVSYPVCNVTTAPQFCHSSATMRPSKMAWSSSVIIQCASVPHFDLRATFCSSCNITPPDAPVHRHIHPPTGHSRLLALHWATPTTSTIMSDSQLRPLNTALQPITSAWCPMHIPANSLVWENLQRPRSKTHCHCFATTHPHLQSCTSITQPAAD